MGDPVNFVEQHTWALMRSLILKLDPDRDGWWHIESGKMKKQIKKSENIWEGIV